jgi:hypothetical protein
MRRRTTQWALKHWLAQEVAVRYSGEDWFMGKNPVVIDSLGDFISKVMDFDPSFRLVDDQRNKVSIKMGDAPGEIMIGRLDNEI